LIQVAEGDIEVAQRGIVYIDEIDKIRAGGSGDAERPSYVCSVDIENIN